MAWPAFRGWLRVISSGRCLFHLAEALYERKQVPFWAGDVVSGIYQLGGQFTVLLVGRFQKATIAHLLVMLTRRSLSTRLETRTKESNIYASAWVTNLDA